MAEANIQPVQRPAMSQLAGPILVVLILAMMVLPLPPIILDLLFTFNISVSLLVVLMAVYVNKPLDFSLFPTVLLLTTLLRLSLNVASTRVVLLYGHTGADAAGKVIESFGYFLIGGNYAVGIVVFIVLVIINFVVITKGSGRIAEVAARFTLDAMPGKQMAIDADLNAGLIAEQEARRRRAEVAKEAEFYGAMDGASKFVKGDAIAGIVIIVINLVGGIAIGMLTHGQSIQDAVSTYSLLTIGDGLVTQVPALLMAVSTGMIVTRSGAESDMGSTASSQLAQSRLALLIAGGAAIAMAFIPGMPFIPFVLVGVTLIIVGQRIKAAEKAKAAAAVLADRAEQAAPAETTEELVEQMRVHALEIQLAADLVDLVSGVS